MDASNDDFVSALPSELKNIVEDFKRSAETLSDQFREAMDVQPPSILCHYTNDTGLHGILKSGRLWLGHFSSMNDPSELKHGRSLASKLFEEAGWHEFAEYLNRSTTVKTDFFLCSLSEEGNDLSQWRSYGDDGRGFSIGFSGSDLDRSFSNENYPSGSFPSSFYLSYSESELIDIFRRLILAIRTPSQNYSPEQNQECNSQICMELARRIVFFSLHFKHPAYEREKEYRLLLQTPSCQANTALKRSRGYELIRYREFDWRAAGLIPRRIILGPAADPQKSRQFTMDCLQETGIKIADVEIADSGIPYRSFR
ncbi:MAG: DUF2971 domain-containing protein [Acidobacteriaceae bacterium]